MSSSEELNLSVPGSQSSPSIRADWKAGVVVMSGESYPENSFELYDQLIQWIESYLSTADQSLTLELHLNYLNTSSIQPSSQRIRRLERDLVATPHALPAQRARRPPRFRVSA